MVVADRPRSPVPRRVAVLCLSGLLAASCTGSDDASEAVPTTSSTIPTAQTLLRVGVEEWPECLNPLTCDSPALRRQVLDHILPVAFEVDADGELVPSPLLDGEPEVARVGGGMAVTYRLAEGARWNDGRPVTSSDLRGTWEAVMATPAAAKDGYERIVSVDDRDPLTAVVTLDAPYAEWRELFGAGRGWVMQADHLGTDLDLTGRFETELPFSSGPYRLAAWDENGTVLAAAGDHWNADRRPEVDQVRLSRIDIGALEDPRAFDLLVPSGGTGDPPEGFERRRLPTASVLGIWFDQRDPLLAPVEHRQAIAGGLDPADLLGEAVPEPPDELIDCLGWLPGTAECEVGGVDLPDHAPDLSRFGLASAGWVPGAFGVLARDEVLFGVPLTYDPAVPGAEAVAEVVEASLASVGVVAEPLPMAASTWRGDRPASQPTGIGVFPVELGDLPRVEQLYGCVDGAESSTVFWCPAAVVASARALRSTLSREQRLELVRRIGSAAGQAVVWLPIAQMVEVSFIRSGRVTTPDQVPAGGGPLYGLRRFEVG